MEGRARARPDPRRKPPGRKPKPPSMEGRARARPDAMDAPIPVIVLDGLQWRAGHVPGLTSQLPTHLDVPHLPFNGGPGTCPA